MAPDAFAFEDGPAEAAFGEGLPPVEDAAELAPDDRDEVSEDAVEEVILDQEARDLDGDMTAAPPSIPVAPVVVREDEDTSDVAYLPDVPVITSTSARERRKGDWESELSAHAIAIELRKIESEVREILEERDPKRKRKLSGTHRWQELEDDILSWYGGGRFDDDTLGRLRDLVSRRHYLFRHLNFLAFTRPTWNS